MFIKTASKIFSLLIVLSLVSVSTTTVLADSMYPNELNIEKKRIGLERKLWGKYHRRKYSLPLRTSYFK